MVSLLFTRLTDKMFWTESASKINQKTKQFILFIKFVIWLYNDLNMLHALRRKNLQQTNDQGDTESVLYQAWRVFVTVWLFFIGWQDEEPHWRDVMVTRRRLFAIMPKMASKSGFVSFWCVLLLWRSFTPNQIDIVFWLTIECNRGGRQNEK